MKKYSRSIGAAVILLMSFVLCRFVLFGLHGMKSWPVVLLLAGGAVLGVSVLLKCRRLPLFVALGYPLSFAVGALFQQNYADPRGAMTLNSFWSIWMIAYLLIVCAGVAAEIFGRKRAAAPKKPNPQKREAEQKRK